MRVNVLGPLTTVDDAARGAATPRCSLRARLLLASLALSQDPVGRATLLERLWPTIDGLAPQARSDSNLDGYVTEARRLLGDAGAALRANKAERSLVLRRPDSPNATVAVDTDAFEFQTLRRSNDLAQLERALSLIRGPVLAGVDHGRFPWLEKARNRLIEDCSDAVTRLDGWSRAKAHEVVSDFMSEPHGTMLDAVRSQQASAGPERETRSVEEVLATRYTQDAPSLRTLAQLVVPMAPPYYDTIVSLELRDSSTSGEYELTYQLEMTAQLDEFVIALTSRASLTDLLLAECPDISDSFTCSSEEGRVAFAHDLTEGTKPPMLVWCLQRTPRGATQRTRIRLEAMTPTQAIPILRGLTEQASDVVLLRGKLPGPRGSVRRIAHKVCDPRMKVSEHYAFWLADRPMFLNRIRIDATAFSPQVHVHPTLGNIANEWEWTNQQCDIAVNNWVVKNQGVFLTW